MVWPVPLADELDVSVVLAVYNERGHLRDEIERIEKALDASPYTFEIIVVDDGSNDGSEHDLQTIDGIRLIRHTVNRGCGAARRTGTTAARGRVVVWTDVDMTYPNDLIPDLVAKLDGCDQVVGARRTEQGTKRIFRVPAKWFIRRLASYLTDTDIPDLNSGLRAFRRDVGMQFMHQLPAGFSCVTTLTMSFLSNGYQVKYTPIDYFPRAGTSKFHWWRDTKRYLLQVARMSLSYNPLKVFLPIGLTLLLVGIGKLVYDWISKDFRLAGNTLLVLIAAFQAIAVGLLADLIVRVTKPSSQVPPRVRATAEVATGNTYDKYNSTNPIEQWMMRGFLRRLDAMLAGLEPLRILEVGVGEGQVMSRLRERFEDVPILGVDLPDAAFAENWRERRLTCLFGDATALPFPDRSFDLVLAIEVLEHVPSPARALGELARVCSGTFIGSVPFEPIWRAGNIVRRRYVSDWGNTPGHVNHWTRWGFSRFVRGAFDVHEVSTPLPWTMVRASVGRRG